MVGAFAVILGLYVVLWGKAKDLEELRQQDHDDQRQSLDIKVDECSETSCTRSINYLEEPLLLEK